jgi:hypothetical protein
MSPPARSKPNAEPQLKKVKMRLRLLERRSETTYEATAAAEAGMAHPDAIPNSTRAAAT